MMRKLSVGLMNYGSCGAMALGERTMARRRFAPRAGLAAIKPSIEAQSQPLHVVEAGVRRVWWLNVFQSTHQVSDLANSLGHSPSAWVTWWPRHLAKSLTWWVDWNKCEAMNVVRRSSAEA